MKFQERVFNVLRLAASFKSEQVLIKSSSVKDFYSFCNSIPGIKYRSVSNDGQDATFQVQGPAAAVARVVAWAQNR